MARTVVFAVTCMMTALLVFSISLPPKASAGFCAPNWYNLGSWVNSFTYNDGQRKVVWTGSVTLYEYWNSWCDITAIKITYGVGGGTVTLKKSSSSQTVFISFSIQYPSSFSDYNDVWRNRIGDLSSVNPPPGQYSGYVVEKIDETNHDEFIIQTTDTVQHTISSVVADFRLWTCGGQSCIGKTVYAQIHAGFNLQNQVVAIYIPP